MTPTQGYPIPTGEARTELRVANSRFIASAGPAATVDAARAFIARVRTEFADATHNVFAFVVGHGASTTLGMSDDGEPAGTAGRPALAVLQGSGLGDVVVVVTRYFGGTLLGTGGLVRAYGDAVRAVLAVLPRGVKVERRCIDVTLGYAAYQATRRLVAAHHGEVLDEIFAAEVTLRLRFALADLEPFVLALRDLTAGAARVQPLPAEERS